MLSLQSSRNIVVLWSEVTNATNYSVSLYSSSGERIGEVEETAALVYTFDGPDLDLKFGTEYTVGVIAEGQNYLDSLEARESIVTDSFILSAPMGISLLGTANSVTVSWARVDPALKIEKYLLNISPNPEGIEEQEISVLESEYTFTGLSADTRYVLSVVSSRDETGYVASSAYRATARTTGLPQLDAPTGLGDRDITGNSISLAWSLVAEATTFNVNLYSGVDTSMPALQTLTILQSGENNFALFEMLSPVTQYTIEVIAQAENHRDSVPLTITRMTTKKQLETPTADEIGVTPSTDSATITFKNTPTGVTGYRLLLEDNVIFRTTLDMEFLIEDSPIVVDNLVPGQRLRYSLVVRNLLFDSNFYTEPTGSAYSIAFTTKSVDPLSNPTMLTAVTEARRESAATVSDIRVAWDSVENAQRYTVRLYAGSDSSGGTLLRSTISVSALATTAVFRNQLNNQFFTVGVTAESDIYPDSQEVRVSVLPPKLLSQFFAVTPSSASLSLAWDSSFNASLEDGVNFYDVTRIGNSEISILRISIEDLNEGEIIAPMEVSTGEGAYSIDGLDEGTDYILKIVQRVTIGSVSLDSETLEIPFRTLEALPIPREEQISWTADGTTLTVEWDNAAAGVTSYDLTLTRTDGLIDTVVGPIEVDARMAGSTTFTSLDAGTNYALSVVAKGDASLYAPSPEYRVTVTTNAPGQLGTPDIRLTIQSSRNIVVSWDGVTNAESYSVSLYSSSGERIGEMKETAALVYTFEGLDLGLKFGTEYTVGVIAQGQNFPDSLEARDKIVTERFILTTPRNGDITLTADPKTVTVQWNDAPAEVTAFVLSIRPDTRDVGEQTIEVSGRYTFENLLPDTEYTVSVVSSRDETGFDKSGVYMGFPCHA
ncbi:MAG: fibronectin type III domain-containing protein, partial [Candidatus Oxydemutatoraceae bacterium WSBS_2016_MAG_OTU14]